ANPPDAAPEGEAARAGVGDDPGRDHPTLRLAGAVDVAEQASASGADQVALGVDQDMADPPGVEHPAAVPGALPGDAVAAAADGEQDAVVGGEAHGGRDVVVVASADDGPRPAV